MLASSPGGAGFAGIASSPGGAGFAGIASSPGGEHRGELVSSLEVRTEVRTPWCYRLPRFGGLDGLMRLRGGVVHRLLHLGETAVHIRVAQLAPDRVLFGARAVTGEAAEWGTERMRAALGVDHDVRAFHERFRHDPLIGAAVRRDPGLRVIGRPEPFEALTWAICQQLIEFERAATIERRLIARLGRHSAEAGLRDSPTAATLAAQAPALLQSFDLSAGRSLALVKAAREVASGRVDLHDPDHERGWRRLRAIPGIGSWTVQSLALGGQGRLDQIPAGDLAFVKLVGRLRGGGDPWARASEAEVEEFFAPYAPWAGLAGSYALRAGVSAIGSVSHGELARAARSSFSFA